MYNKLKVYLLASTLLLGVITVSCQKEQDITLSKVASTASSQNTEQEALVEAMAHDGVVREYVIANEEMLNAYEQWYTGLPEAERHSLDAAYDAGGPLPDNLSAEQRHEFNAAQQDRADQIKASFSQLNSLSDAEKSSVWAHVIDTVISSSSLPRTPYMTCHAAYNDCSWYCVDHGGGGVCLGGCLTGFRTCIR
jgi:hypothetical protein